MNRLELKEMNENHIIYKYFPNNEEAFGEIKYSFSKGKAIIVSKTTGDETGYFARKAQSKVEDIAENEKELPRNFTQAWY